MTRIVKSCGSEEEFAAVRLKRSILSAGATPEIADMVTGRVSTKVNAMGNIPTDDLAGLVAEELQNANPVIARSYMATENMRAVTGPGAMEGVIRVPETVAARHSAHSGEEVDVFNGNLRIRAKILPEKVIDPRDIVISRADVQRLGVEEGGRIGVRFDVR